MRQKNVVDSFVVDVLRCLVKYLDGEVWTCTVTWISYVRVLYRSFTKGAECLSTTFVEGHCTQ